MVADHQGSQYQAGIKKGVARWRNADAFEGAPASKATRRTTQADDQQRNGMAIRKSKPAPAAFLHVDGTRLGSINLETPADRHPIPNRLSTSVRDHNKLDLDRLFANSSNVGRHRCESVQHEASNQLLRETMGKHQGLGDAARNVSKPLQGTTFVEGHWGPPSSTSH
jgi:hypothetical protein